MKLNSKVRILCGTLALSLILTACQGAGAQGTETGSTEGNVSVEQENSQVVGNSPETEEVTLTAEELEWQNYLMADVQNTLNVRAEANSEAEVIGLLAKGDRATILEVGEEWTKISSGNLEGYVSNSYCLMGLDALAYAKENCDMVATTTGDALNIRKSPSTDAEVVGQLKKGQTIVVDVDAEAVDGWVAVFYKNNTTYVSAEYVTVDYEVGTGLTMVEIVNIEKEKKRAEEEARKKAEAAANADTSWIHNYTDYEIMVAIVYCEARGESYECQLAVAAVVLNRVESGKFPNSIKEVIAQKGQFTPAYSGTLKSALANGKSTATGIKAVDAALAGEDNTNGCLFFRTNRGDKEGLVIGRMVFY